MAQSSFICAALASALLAVPAGAATISFSNSVPLQDVELSGTLSVAQFDPSLGTLTGVSWSITGAIASILGISNDAPGEVTGSAFTEVRFFLDSAALSLAASPDFTVVGATGDVTLAAGEVASFPVTNGTTISGAEAPGAIFIGLGTVDLDFLTATRFGGDGFGGDITISQATDAELSFDITYEFTTTAIPLPPAVALLAGALAVTGLMVTSRRRRA